MCKLKRYLKLKQEGKTPNEAYLIVRDEHLDFEKYIKLKKEAGYYEMTMLDKRRKDRKFGKFVKGVKEHQKKLKLLKEEGGDDN